MSALPPQPPQMRPSSPEQQLSESRSNDEAMDDAVPSSEQPAVSNTNDSQSLIPIESRQTFPEADVSEQSISNATIEESKSSEPRHCWICLQDEGDEGSDNSQWRSPCPCNLQAHEACMLEWITDLEAPNSRTGRATNKILCPQCKAEIRVARPVEHIVSLITLIGALGRIVVLPASLGAIIGCLYSGSLVYGVNTFYLVFGPDDAHGLLAGSLRGSSVLQNTLTGQLQGAFSKLFRITDPFLPFVDRENWRLVLGLPLVAPALILTRTDLADTIFPILPVTYFAFRSKGHNLRQWPPSPGLAFAVLPYVRSAYNELYKITFAGLEKKWDQAVRRKPREGETAEQVAEAQAAQDAEGGIAEIGIEIIHVREAFEPDPAPAGAAEAGPAAELQEFPPEAPDQLNLEGPQAEAPAADAQPGDQPPPEQPAPAAAGNEWEFQQNISTAQLATAVVGALFLPALSSIMGDLLKLTLPRHWVTKPLLLMDRRTLGGHAQVSRNLPATGLLQEKWGRSIVGGCLFVVVKDALLLYVKWRRARNQGLRRVVDWVPKGKEKGKTKGK